MSFKNPIFWGTNYEYANLYIQPVGTVQVLCNAGTVVGAIGVSVTITGMGELVLPWLISGIKMIAEKP